MEDLLEDERQSQGLAARVEEDDESTHVKSTGESDESVEELPNCDDIELIDETLDILKLVDEPVESALWRGDWTWRPPEQLNPSVGRSYAQVVANGGVVSGKTKGTKLKLELLRDLRSWFKGLRPGTNMCHTCKCNVKHEPPKCKEYIKAVCNFIREKEAKHNLITQVEKEDVSLTYDDVEAKVLGQCLVHYASCHAQMFMLHKGLKKFPVKVLVQPSPNLNKYMVVSVSEQGL